MWFNYNHTITIVPLIISFSTPSFTGKESKERQELPLRRQVAEEALHSNELAQLLLAQHRSKALHRWTTCWERMARATCGKKLGNVIFVCIYIYIYLNKLHLYAYM